jgi:hypothetical protein
VVRRREFRIIVQAIDDAEQVAPKRYEIKQILTADMVECAVKGGHSLETALDDAARYAVSQLAIKLQKDDG